MTEDVKQEGAQQPGLPTAEQMRGIVPTKEQLHERNVRANLERMFEELARSANMGNMTHAIQVNVNFPKDVLKGITDKLEELGYKVTIEEKQVTAEIKALTVTVDWSA